MKKTRLKGALDAGGRSAVWAIALAAGMMVPAGSAVAQICDARWPQIQFARDDLQRAASEGDFASAQDYADRARREFDHLAALAGRCDCPPAAVKFQDMATRIRHAQDVETRKDLREIVNDAKMQLEMALAQLQDCRRH